MAFVFYDTETTGSDTFYDQILQFAAIRTDDALNEIDRFEIRCRIQPHTGTRFDGVNPELGHGAEDGRRKHGALCPAPTMPA